MAVLETFDLKHEPFGIQAGYEAFVASGKSLEDAWTEYETAMKIILPCSYVP